MNHIFRRRLERFSEELADVKGRIEISGNGTGQYFLLKFAAQADQNELIRKALEHGVKVYPTMEFWQEKAASPTNSQYLGYSKISIEDIPDCVERIRAAWKEWI